MKSTNIGSNEIEGISQFLKIMSGQSRLAILFALKQEGEMNVTQIADRLYMEQSAVSHQLKLLKDVRLIRDRQEGKQRFYSLNDEHVFNILRQVAEHIQEEDTVTD